MSKKPIPEQSAIPTKAEAEELRKRSLAFNAEAARAGLFAAALDMLDTMKEQGVEEAEAAVMTGVVEAAAQLWQQVSHQAKIPTQKARRTFLGECQCFFGKWVRRTREGAESETKQ